MYSCVEYYEEEKSCGCQKKKTEHKVVNRARVLISHKDEFGIKE